jgi:3-dehydroquinate synthase
MSDSNVRVALGERSYDIAIGAAGLAGLGAFGRQRCQGGTALVVGDGNTAAHAEAAAASLAAAGFRVGRHLLPAGEAHKNLATVAALYDALAELPADRRTVVAAVGGGVVGDVTGFAAATFNRGLPFVQVPTTLLAMVDSAVGGKTGVNHPRGKNLIGAFHQPAGVWIATDTLATLPEREYRSGMAEVVKYGVILDADFFAWLEGNAAAILAREPAAVGHVVARSCRLKADVVEQDERELTGLRAVLNYGHTFAHAFETVAGYGAWLHGEAVAAGMVCASRLAERRGQVSSEITDRQRRLLERFGLPVAPEPWPAEALLEVMRHDKKNLGGRLRLVLPTRLGAVRLFDDVAEAEVRAVLA